MVSSYGTVQERTDLKYGEADFSLYLLSFHREEKKYSKKS
jgi:hypothetical protein